MAYDATDAERAYAAGLLDGEGALQIARRIEKSGRPYYFARISVCNTHFPVLDWLRTRWGGRVHNSNSNSRYGNKTCWSWVIDGGKARPFLDAVWPYLIIKRERAEVFSQFLALVRKGDCTVDNSSISEHAEADRERLFLLMRKLNGKCSKRDSESVEVNSLG